MQLTLEQPGFALMRRCIGGPAQFKPALLKGPGHLFSSLVPAVTTVTPSLQARWGREAEPGKHAWPEQGLVTSSLFSGLQETFI